MFDDKIMTPMKVDGDNFHVAMHFVELDLNFCMVEFVFIRNKSIDIMI